MGNGDLVGMVSREGEVVPLKTRIKPSLADGAVEKWLVQVPICWHLAALGFRGYAQQTISACCNASRGISAAPACVLGAL